MDWVAKIDEWELIAEAPGISLIQMDGHVDVDDVLIFMVEGGPMQPQASFERDPLGKARYYLDNDPRPPRKYWGLVREEIIELICTDTDKYRELRGRINRTVGAAEKGVVAMVSAKVASTLGVEAGIISGLCALCLFSVKSVGVNAFCKKIGCCD